MRPAGFSVISVILVAVALGAAAVGGAAEPQPRDTSTASAEAKLGPCAKNVRPKRLRCGRLRVPLERSDEAQGFTRVTYALRRRTDSDRPSLGTILTVEGGPGYGSIGSARYYIHMLGPLLERRDLLLVDMRGTGHSRAIDCPKLQQGKGSDGAGVAQCARILGKDFEAYRTSAAADDLDAVRAKLGIDRLLLYGDSYGTYLSQSYAYRHGDRLDALVLDSAYPLRGESGWYPSLTRTGIRSLGVVCERRPGRCQGDALARLDMMVGLLRQTPRGPGPLLDAIGAAGYEPPVRNYLAIDTAISEYLAGNRKPYRRLTRAGNGGYGNARYYSRGDELAVSCNDYPMLWDKSAGDAQRRAQLRRAVRTYPKQAFAPFTPREVAIDSSWGYHECLRWPQPTSLYQPPAPAGRSAPGVPTLVISGELDNVTSVAEGRKVASQFPNSRQMVVRNGGHVPSLYGGRYKARDRVRDFLLRHGG